MLTSDHVEPGIQHDAPEEDDDVYRDLEWYWRGQGFPRTGLRARLRLERRNAAALRWHLDDFGPGVVCWWAMGGMSLGLIELVRRSGIPAVGVVADDWMDWGPRVDAWLAPFQSRPRAAALAERLTRLPAEVDLAGAATWLFAGERVRRESMLAAGEPRRSALVHPGVDHELLAPAPERDWGWRLLCSGAVDPLKGVEVAVRSLELLPDEAVLVLAGRSRPAYVPELRRLAVSLGLEERVLLSERPREELPQAYTGADAVLYPVQWDEPWGLAPLEAMAVGRPVVASGLGGSAEYLEHGVNCLLYEPRDAPAELAAAVLDLASDEQLRERLREGGRDTAARFDQRTFDVAVARAVEQAAGATPA